MLNYQWWSVRDKLLAGLFFCFPPQDLTQDLFYSGGLGSRRSGMSPIRCMQVIGLLSPMWARWAYGWTWTRYKTWVRHVYLLIAWTRPESLVLCNACQWRHRPPAGGLMEAGSHSASNLSLRACRERNRYLSSEYKLTRLPHRSSFPTINQIYNISLNGQTNDIPRRRLQRPWTGIIFFFFLNASQSPLLCYFSLFSDYVTLSRLH